MPLLRAGCGRERDNGRTNQGLVCVRGQFLSQPGSSGLTGPTRMMRPSGLNTGSRPKWKNFCWPDLARMGVARMAFPCAVAWRTFRAGTERRRSRSQRGNPLLLRERSKVPGIPRGAFAASRSATSDPAARIGRDDDPQRRQSGGASGQVGHHPHLGSRTFPVVSLLVPPGVPLYLP